MNLNAAHAMQQQVLAYQQYLLATETKSQFLAKKEEWGTEITNERRILDLMELIKPVMQLAANAEEMYFISDERRITHVHRRHLVCQLIQAFEEYLGAECKEAHEYLLAVHEDTTNIIDKIKHIPQLERKENENGVKWIPFE